MSAPGTQYALFELAEVIPVEMQPAESASQRFSDYVVYVDESGDHSLASIDSDYPVFVLALWENRLFQGRVSGGVGDGAQR